MKERPVNKKLPTPMDVHRKEHAVSGEEIDAAVRRVETLETESIPEHVAAFEHAHQVLQEFLNEAVDG